MNKIKFLAHAICLLSAVNSVDINAEYYSVRPGDALSSIANATISKTDLPLNHEQVMLTIFKLNPDAFVNGNIDRVIPNKRIYIPDNIADFIQISKREAQQRLHDQSYLRELFNQGSAQKASGGIGTLTSSGNAVQDYSKVLKTLDNHQQNIELLKLENAHLSKSFKLLERAMGRIIIVQGLLTNDMVKVKSKFINSPQGELAGSAKSQDSSSANEVLSTASDSIVSLPTIDPTLSKADTDVGVQSSERPSEVTAQGNNDGTSLNDGNEKEPTDFWLDIAMVGAILIPVALLMLWFFDFRQIRTKLSTSKSEHDSPEIGGTVFSIKDRLLVPADENRYGSALAVGESSIEDSAPLKMKTEKVDKSIKTKSAVNNASELTNVLELLDMCMLWGDYKQAHSVTLQALVEHQSSPILTKKLAFIERKLGKK